MPPINRPFSFLSIFISALCYVVFASMSYQDVDATENAKLFESISVSSAYPSTANEKNISFALKLYSVKLPSHLSAVKFNPTIYDRGLTYGSGLGSRKTVDIGPAAFTSWGILGSTLGHEIEVHCEQSFMAIWLSELFHLNGTLYAERVAYEYELANGNRYGLSEVELEQIEHTKNYFYPLANEGEKKGSKLKNLVARYFLSSK